MVRALADVSCKSVGLPACLAKCSKAIMGELQYAQTSGATSIFSIKSEVCIWLLIVGWPPALQSH